SGLALPLREQRGTIERTSPQIHAGYLPRVVNVVERVRVEHDEVRALPLGERAHVGDPEQPRRRGRRRDDRIGRLEPQLHPPGQLDVIAGPERLTRINAGFW